jgi:hypothetical protein
MTTINIESPLGLTQIEVVKNPFTDKYIEHIKLMFSKFPSASVVKTYGAIMINTPDNFVHEQIQRLTDTIDELNELGTNFPYKVEPELIFLRNTKTQWYLNDLHRAFTTAHRSLYEGGDMYYWSDKFESKFNLDKLHHDRFLYLIDQINDMVHATELYVKTERKTNNPANLACQAEVSADTFSNNGTRLIKEYFFNIEPEDYKYFSDSNEYDVWVGTNILGKDYLIAYYEHDDAGAWDVTHVLGYSCKIAIDISTITRASIMKTDNFQQWLAEGNVNYTPAMCGMPVGQVINGKEFLATYMKQNRTTDKLQVSFDE